MGSPIKVKTIYIDFTKEKVVNKVKSEEEVDMEECLHKFSIRKFVATYRGKDKTDNWILSEKTLSSMEKYIRSCSPVSAPPKARYAGCRKCVKDIEANVTTAPALHRNLNTVTVTENRLVQNPPVNNVIAPADDKVASNDVVEKTNEEKATSSLKRDHPSPPGHYDLRSRRKGMVPEQAKGAKKASIGTSSRKQKQIVDQAVVMTTPGSPIIAGVVEKTSAKATENDKGGRLVVDLDNVSSESTDLGNMSRVQRRKTPKSRSMIDLLQTGEPAPRRAPVRGRKRKLVPENNNVSRSLSTSGGATSENGAKSCGSDQVDSADTEFGRDPIKGKQKSRTLQVDDEVVPCEASQEGICEKEADIGKSHVSAPVKSLFKHKNFVPSLRGTLSLMKKPDAANKKQKVGFLREKKTKRSLFDDRSASEGLFKKPKDKPIGTSLQLQDNDSRDAVAKSDSSSKSNAGGWLRSGVDVANLKKNEHTSSLPNLKLGHTTSSTDAANPLCVMQKDASGIDRKGKTIRVQEHHETPSRSQGYNRKETTFEEQDDDDVMEIAELMARNQYERSLPDKEEDVSNKKPSQESSPKPKKRLLMIDLNETYESGMPEDNNTTSTPPSSDSNARKMSENNTTQTPTPPPCVSNARKQDHFPLRKQQPSLLQPSPRQPSSQQPSLQQSYPQQPSPQQSYPQQLSLQQSSPQQSYLQQPSLQQSSPRQPFSQQPSLQQSYRQQPIPQQSYPQQLSLQQSSPQQPYLQQPSLQLSYLHQSSPQQPSPQQPSLQQSFPQQPSPSFLPISRPYLSSPCPFGMFTPPPPPVQDKQNIPVIGYPVHNGQCLGNPVKAIQNPPPSSAHGHGPLCGSQYREPAPPVWQPSMMPTPRHNRPVAFNVNQSTSQNMVSQTPGGGNKYNLNYVVANNANANGKKNCGPNPVNGGRSSVDSSPNQSSVILSLMDPRRKSHTPTTHQENTMFTKRHFPPANQVGFHFEHQTGESSKSAYNPTNQSPLNFVSKRFVPDTSRRIFPDMPATGTHSFPFQNVQASWSQPQEKRNDTFVAPVYNLQENSVFGSGSNQGNRQENFVFGSSSNLGRLQPLGLSNSMMLPSRSQMAEADKEKTQKRKAETSNNNDSPLPPPNISTPMVCVVNKNPADFTIPEPGNIYMLSGESLNVRKRATYQRRSTSCKQDASKRAEYPVCPPTENA